MLSILPIRFLKTRKYCENFEASHLLKNFTEWLFFFFSFYSLIFSTFQSLSHYQSTLQTFPVPFLFRCLQEGVPLQHTPTPPPPYQIFLLPFATSLSRLGVSSLTEARPGSPLLRRCLGPHIG